MKPCRTCQKDVAEEAFACPACGAPYPAKDQWDGWGFEYKSKLALFGLPFVHVSFKYRPDRRPVPARGVIAVGQFACGFVTLSQFGIGIVSVSQFTIALVLIGGIPGGKEAPALWWVIIAWGAGLGPHDPGPGAGTGDDTDGAGWGGA